MPTSFPRFATVLALVFSAFAGAQAQSTHPLSFGADYTYIRTNLAPGCACFGLQGGGVEAEYGLSSRFFLLADVTVTHASNITPDHYALTQSTYTFGTRVFPVSPARRLKPFAEFKLGAATATGSLAPSATFGGAGTAFALEAGGGLALHLRGRFDLVPLQADYLHTNFGNTQSNTQNDLRLSVAVLYRIR